MAKRTESTMAKRTDSTMAKRTDSTMAKRTDSTMILKLLHRTLQIEQNKRSNNNNYKTVFVCEKQTNKSPYIIILNTIKNTLK